MEEDNMVMIYSYPLKEEFVHEFVKKGIQLTNADVETDIQKILKDNLIPYKNKLVDSWYGRDYKLVVEIYVYEVNMLRAQQLIDELVNYKGEYHYDETSDNL